MKKNIIIFGTLPPPYGGVTASVQNLYNSLKKYNFDTELYSISLLWTRYHFAHIHFSKDWKRLLGLLLGRLVAQKNVFTIHRLEFNYNSFINKISLRLTDGVLFVNEKTQAKMLSTLVNYKLKSMVISPIFADGFDLTSPSEYKLQRRDDYKYILVYASNNGYRNGQEIYGINFLLKNFSYLPESYIIVFLDPQAAYKNDVYSLDNERLVYISYGVNFQALLRQVDIYLRPTSTDGDSIAVREALLCNIPVIASDSVQRPQGVITYKHGDFSDLVLKLSLIQPGIAAYKLPPIQVYLDFLSTL